MDLESKFREQWPEMFRDVRCGFELPERWEGLVWELSGQIAHILDWAKIPRHTFRVAQVKDKFGGLRFYYDLGPRDYELDTRSDLAKKAEYIIAGLVTMAEAASFLVK